MSMPLSPLLLSRRPRHPGDPSWEEARSWFGGRPALGSRTWPRTSLDRPMTFLAQVDLGEVAREAGPSPLPGEGALTFFVGPGPKEWECAVLHVTGAGAPTDPPADAPAAYEQGGDMFTPDASATAPRSFPRWPLAMMQFPELAEPRDPDDDDEDAWSMRRSAAVEAHLRRRQFFFSAPAAWKALGEAPPPGWWHSAQLLAAHLETALHHLPARIEQQRGFVAGARAQMEKLRPPAPRFGFGRRQAEPTPELKRAIGQFEGTQAKLADLEARAPDFAAFVKEVGDWARGHDPSTPLQPDQAARLRAEYERSRKAFDDFARYRVPSSFDEIESATLRAMMTGSERAFAAIPEPMRDHINANYLLPTDSWHQMFGVGVDIQGNAASENEGNVMLLQLMYDDMLDWRFGDMGAFQFWIPAADLAVGRWKAATVSFEAH